MKWKSYPEKVYHCDIIEMNDGNEGDRIGECELVLLPSNKRCFELNDQLIKTHYNTKTIYFNEFWLIESKRNQGIGSFILKNVLLQIKKKNTNYEKLILICKHTLSHFYERLGFSKLGVSEYMNHDVFYIMGINLK